MAIHNCHHSSYIRYNHIKDYHNCGGINTGNTYNIKYNCNGGGTSFWGGFGAGLGFNFGNMVSGLFGNFMGGFGGFGFGMPGWGNFWGGGVSYSTPSSTDYSKKYGSSTSTPSSNTDKPVNTGNADTPKLRELTDTFNNLLANKIADKDISADIDKLISDLEALIANPLDEANAEDDKKLYENLKLRAQQLKDGTLPGVDQSVVKPEPGLTGTGYQVKIGDKVINSVDDLNAIKPSDFANLIKDMSKETAIAVLVKVGYINFDATSPQYKDSNVEGTCNYLCGKMSKYPNVLMLLEKAEVATEVYRGDSSQKDNWVTGKISDIKFDNDGNLTSFNVNCRKNGHNSFQGAYTFTTNGTDTNGTKFKVTTTANNTVTKIVSGGDSVVLNTEQAHCTGRLSIKNL